MAGIGFIDTKLISQSLKKQQPGLALRLGGPPGSVLSSKAVGAGLVGAGIGSGVALGTFAAGIAEAAPALAAAGPYGAAALAALGIADLVFGGALNGKPKMLDTAQATARLFQSRDPELQQLARNFAILVRNDAPLSSGNPRIQAQIRDWIGGAVDSILSRYGLAHDPVAVSQLDGAIHRVLSSEIAAPGASIDNLIAQLGARGSAFAQLPAPQPSPQLAPRGPGPRLLPSPRPLAPFSQPQPPSTSSRIWDTLSQSAKYLLGPLAAQLSEAELAELGGCLGTLVLSDGTTIPFAIKCLEHVVVTTIFDNVKQIGNRLLGSLRSLLHSQPNGQPSFPPLSPQPHRAPKLDESKPCPSCSPRGRELQREIRSQQERTLRDIRTETDQEIEEQLSQQEQQLTQLEHQETQPAGQRDINRELQQKQNILQNLQQQESQLINQGQTQPAAQPGAEPAPRLIESQQQQNAQELEHELESQSQHETPLTFCIGCKSQEDAIMFLNGEPSACSVMPGTTKYIQTGG